MVRVRKGELYFWSLESRRLAAFRRSCVLDAFGTCAAKRGYLPAAPNQFG
jgi:hypothetical protein